MAVGLAAARANSFLNVIFNATNITAPTEAWIKLHVGDPGASGTANAATETTRKQVSCGAASAGAIANDAALEWTNVAGTEDYTHCSIHDASTAGTFECSGTVTANAVTAGDSFTVAIGDLDITLTAIAA